MVTRRTLAILDRLRDLLAAGGAVLVGYGVWLIHRPTALIVIGGALIALAIRTRRK